MPRSEYDTQLSETTDLDGEPVGDPVGSDIPPQLWAWLAFVAMAAAVLLAYATGGRR